jgi:hypothetical protein
MATCCIARGPRAGFITRARRLLWSACTVALVACGGGAGEPVAPADGGRTAGAGVAGTPGITLDPPATVGQSNRIGLAWQAPGDFTSFTVFVQRAAGQPFEAVDAVVAGQTAQFARGAAYRLDFPTARVRVRGCIDATRCVDSNEQPLVDALVGGLVRLSAAPFGNRFSGVVLSADGNTLAVNASNPYSNAQCDAIPGAVLVFQRGADGHWTQEAELTQSAPGSALFDSMPYALSGDGNTLVVTNVVEDAMQVFTRDAQRNWSRQAFIQGPVPSVFGAFGEKVAISHDGNRIVVGTNRGPIYVFERAAASWRQAQVIEGGPGILLVSAWTLAISADGSSVAVPAILEADGSVRVHVYRPCSACAGGWQLAGDLRSSKPAPSENNDGFGQALSFSRDGNTLAVGAFRDPGDASDNGTMMNAGSPASGAVYVFAADAGGSWQRRAFLKARTAPASDQLGVVVSLSGDGKVLLAGACGLAANAAGLRRNHRADATLGPPGEGDDTRCAFGGTGGSGYVFEVDASGAWSHTAAAIAAPGERTSLGDFSIPGLGTFAGGGHFFLTLSADAQTSVLLAPLGGSAGNPDRVVVH